MKTPLPLLLFVLFFMSSISVYSQDRYFAYAYQSNVLNKGGFDIEFQNELLTGKQGKFSPYIYGQHLNQRLEFEFGLGSKVQTSFYLNSELFSYADTSMETIEQELKLNFSNEWKWKLLDPVADVMGVALYEEVEVGGNNFESETKLIVDKQWRNDLIAFNAVGVYEIERVVVRENGKSKVEWEKSYPIEFNLGYMHFFNPRVGLGFEVFNVNDISEVNGWINSLLYGGVSLHVQSGSFFANISALPQLSNLHTTDFAPGNMDFDGGEKLASRLVIGYSF